MDKLAYRKESRLRPFGVGGVEITIPKVVIDKAAREAGETIAEFIKTHRAIHLFNDFAGFSGAYRFERIQETEALEMTDKEVGELGVKPPQLSEFDEMRRKLQGGT